MSAEKRQHTPQSEQSKGGNISGHAPPYRRYLVPNFQGKAGTPSPNETFRTKGR